MEETVLFPYDTWIFADALYRICDGHEHKYTNPVPSEHVPIFWRLPEEDKYGRRFISHLCIPVGVPEYRYKSALKMMLHDDRYPGSKSYMCYALSF